MLVLFLDSVKCLSVCYPLPKAAIRHLKANLMINLQVVTRSTRFLNGCFEDMTGRLTNHCSSSATV